ncbi:MAG TPA: tetratricopeptide repeat protein [Verrucomicrobiae bacterium]|nr:tetratricopeptide repeat protein [Verrucomicrobiae bacterium]
MRTRFLLSFGAALLFSASIAFAQSQSQQSQSQQSQSQQSQSQQSQQSQQQSTSGEQTQKPSLANPLKDVFPPTPPPVDPKEEAAFQSFSAIQSTPANGDAQIKAGAEFLKNYPQSRYRETVYARLANAYLDKNDTDKMCDAAEQALSLNPNDITVLIPVGEAIPRSDPKNPQYVPRLAKAETYEHHALDVLNTVTKPANLTDEQFAATKSNAVAEAHSGLGLIYFVERKFDQSTQELQLSIGKNHDLDATNFFVLGLDSENMQKYPDAVKAFDSCAQISSPIQDRCKKASDDAKSKEKTAPQSKP